MGDSGVTHALSSGASSSSGVAPEGASAVPPGVGACAGGGEGEGDGEDESKCADVGAGTRTGKIESKIEGKIESKIEGKIEGKIEEIEGKIEGGSPAQEQPPEPAHCASPQTHPRSSSGAEAALKLRVVELERVLLGADHRVDALEAELAALELAAANANRSEVSAVDADPCTLPSPSSSPRERFYTASDT